MAVDGDWRSAGARHMRLYTTTVLILLLVGATGSALGEAGTVVLHHAGQDQTTGVADDTLRMLAMELLKSSNFNARTHPDLLKQGVCAIHDRYRRTLAGDFLFIAYNHPATVRTIGGPVSVLEIIIGLGHPDYADALFTIDGDARVVAHEKYSGQAAMQQEQSV
jgi:hypothetical protein